MGKFARTWQLMGASWQLLKQDKRLVMFPLISSVALGLVQSTLQTIYQAAVYRYAADGQAPKGFDGQLIADAFRVKQRKSWT
ncbi:MAG: hypothetical protein KGL98_08110 [Gammaproteobacteria bacterium]|nr:hypothetical protein [Gammaproteobacteria bacterium]MBU6509395.1 hypothetical protein [Gammaproteobacteria bacterium]MDE2109472.1 hypothetical protein [Gammaproteobacteria bacterium]MDE2461199.1 hypothetical protein [Gammaproteobacteria bacterium]